MGSNGNSKKRQQQQQQQTRRAAVVDQAGRDSTSRQEPLKGDVVELLGGAAGEMPCVRGLCQVGSYNRSLQEPA
ncbi:hypothetical protein KI387_044732, partial [Taxus chinensis]